MTTDDSQEEPEGMRIERRGDTKASEAAPEQPKLEQSEAAGDSEQNSTSFAETRWSWWSNVRQEVGSDSLRQASSQNCPMVLRMV